MEDSERIEQILSSLGFHKIQDKGDYITCAIPNHNNPTGLSVLKENLYCNAFSTHMDFKGGIFDLIAYMNRYDSFGDTMRWCHKTLGLKYEYNGKKEEPKEDSILNFFKKYSTGKHKGSKKEIELKKYTDEEIFDMYVRCSYANWIKEGIIAIIQKEFCIGYHFDSKRVVIPHRYWKDGSIVGLIGRTICSDEEIEYFGVPKYFPLIPYPKSKNLYGLWENMESIKQSKEIIIFEAEKSVMKMASRGIRNCVSVGCHDLSEEQVKILLSLNVNEIIIAYDSDVDRKFIAMECKKFKGLKSVSAILNKDNILGDKESPADLCLRDFTFLYDNRVKYKPKKVK